MNSVNESFIQETEKLIEETTKNLLALEIDPEVLSEIDGAARSLHSLKALAQTVGIKWMGLTAHLAESVLGNVKSKKLAYTQEVGDLLFQVLDLLREKLYTLPNSPPLATAGLLKLFGDGTSKEEIIKFLLPAIPQKFLTVMTSDGETSVINSYDQDKTIGILKCRLSDPVDFEKVYGELDNLPVEPVVCLADNKDKDYMLEALVITSQELGESPLEHWNWTPLTQKNMEVQEGGVPERKSSKNPLEKLQKELLGEVEERLNNITQWVLRMEKANGEKEQREAFYEAFRLIHSLKGASFLYGFNLAGEATGGMEEMFLKVQEAGKLLSPVQIDVVLKGIDTLRRTFPPVNDPHAAPLISQSEVESIMKQLSRAFQENAALRPEQTQTSLPKPEEQIRLPRKRLDKLVAITGELITSLDGFERLSRSFDDFTLQLSKWLRFPNPETSSGLTASASNIGLKFSLLLSKISKLLNGLRQEALSARMIPICQLLASFPRAVRDIARSLGKEAVLEMQGTETELDRSIADALHDPLMHLIRNAVDHGIELPDVREKLGKPRRGRITIKARPQGNQIVVEVSDDGRGLDSDKIKKKALEQGVLSQDTISAVSEKELYELIFAPGFSTSSTVTDISGRGVGMNVVRTAIEEIKGGIEISSIRGQGVTFHLTVPLTLALLQGLFFRVGKEIMAIPGAFVRTVKKISKDEIQWLEGRSVLNWEGGSIIASDLGELLGMEGEWRPMAIVASFGTMSAAFTVDEVLEVEEMVLKDLGILLSKLPLVTGCTVRHDGNLTVVLDVPSLIRSAHASNIHTIAITPRLIPKKKRILLAEDSITTRQLFFGLLSLSGYDVIEARDGQEALELLRYEPVDLVLTDVQMPKLDGLALTREVKAGYPLIPVVMMTALSKEEERLEGIKAGADAYVVKGTFKSQDLFHIIGQLIGFPISAHE